MKVGMAPLKYTEKSRAELAEILGERLLDKMGQLTDVLVRYTHASTVQFEAQMFVVKAEVAAFP